MKRVKNKIQLLVLLFGLKTLDKRLTFVNPLWHPVKIILNSESFHHYISVVPSSSKSLTFTNIL